jgi:archaeal arginyl aminopeptidase
LAVVELQSLYKETLLKIQEVNVMRALIISGDNFEDTELLVPYYRLLEEKIETDIVSIEAGTIGGIHGYRVKAFSLDQINTSSYNLLLLPGGKAPATLRNNNKILVLVRDFFKKGKLVAAICHGPQILVTADVLLGRYATCYKGMARELSGAGCNYIDTSVVVDGNLITSRVPADLPDFMREIMARCSRIQEKGDK